MASEREWLLLTAEKCLREEEQRVEQDSPINFSVIDGNGNEVPCYKGKSFVSKSLR